MRKKSLFALGLVLALIASVANADFTVGEPTVVIDNYVSGPSISTDGLALYFHAQDEPGNFNIWVVTWETTDDLSDGIATTPTPPNSAYSDANPDISADDLTLYFSSHRPGGSGGSDMWLTTRATADEPWSEPVNLGPTINSEYYEGNSSISSDGLSLFFVSDRPGGYGSRDIYVSTRATINDPWSEPVNLGPIVNSPAWDSGANISSDGLILFFSSDRPGGYGRDDVWMTRRATTEAPWGEPKNLGPVVNDSQHNYTPCISADGSVLYWYSQVGRLNRVPIKPVVDFNGDYRIDIEDLILLIEHWGQDEPSLDMGPTPFGDGIVDAEDLQVLMSHWGQDANFIAHWKLDETGGDVAYDSAADNDAVVMGDALWQREGGCVDGALQLDGVTSYLSAPFIIDPPRQPFSAYVWVKGGQPGQTIMSQQGALGEWLSLDAAGALTCTLTFPLPAVTSNVLLTDDQWHHIGLVCDGAGISLYVNDVEVTRSDTSPVLPAVGDLQIGAGKNLEPASFWSGLIDDVRIYDRVVVP